jgi:hypothetical protein
MAQYHPDHKVGGPARDGHPSFVEIDRAPRPAELRAALEAARHAGLWRFDARP